MVRDVELREIRQGIFENASEIMHRLAAHYISHLQDTERVKMKIFKTLRKSAETYLMCVDGFDPLIKNSNKYEYDRRMALALVARVA